MIERGLPQKQPKAKTQYAQPECFPVTSSTVSWGINQISASVIFTLFFICFSAAKADLVLTEVAAATLDGQGRDASAEILAIDQRSNTIFVINSATSTLERFQLLSEGVRALDLSYQLRPLSPIHLSLSEGKARSAADSVPRSDDASASAATLISAVATSVDVWPDADLVAVSMALIDDQTRQPPKGVVLFFEMASGKRVHRVEVGHHPDMIKFLETPSRGLELLVANEGEPHPSGRYDGLGSISIIEMGSGTIPPTAPEGWRIHQLSIINPETVVTGTIRSEYGPEDWPKDLEPEYLAVSRDGSNAYVSLQENNAIATIDLNARRVSRLFSLGTKDHDREYDTIDTKSSDKTWQLSAMPIRSYFMPDAIATFEKRGNRYLVTANEGDTRSGNAQNDVIKVSDINCGSRSPLPVWSSPQNLKQLNKLEVDRLPILEHPLGCPEQINAFGGRSISVWDLEKETLIWDSGDHISRSVAACLPANRYDKRSTKRGAEPESLALWESGERVIVFAGLERGDGILAYDLTDPEQGRYTGGIFFKDRRHRGPESMVFLPDDSNPDQGLLVASFEYTGTLGIFSVTHQADPPLPLTPCD